MLRRRVCAQELLRAAKRLAAQVAAAVASKTPPSASPGTNKAAVRAGTPSLCHALPRSPLHKEPVQAAQGLRVESAGASGVSRKPARDAKANARRKRPRSGGGCATLASGLRRSDIAGSATRRPSVASDSTRPRRAVSSRGNGSGGASGVTGCGGGHQGAPLCSICLEDFLKEPKHAIATQ